MEASALVTSLLMPESWPRYAQVVDENAAQLVTDIVDGRLALVGSAYRHDWDFSQRVGAVRMSLELARWQGFDGISRPMSYYFKGWFGPSGSLPDFSPPTAPDRPAGEPEAWMLAEVALAIVKSRTWEQRRRLLIAYEPYVHSGELSRFLRGLEEQGVSPHGLGDVVSVAAKSSVDAAIESAPFEAFLSLPSLCGQPAQMTRDERLQLAFLAYLHTPSWVRRREVVRHWSDPLLTVGEDEMAWLWDQARQLAPAVTVERAKAVLVAARRRGLASAFDTALPPSHVIMASAASAIASASDARDRVPDLRRLVHFYDPDIFPTMHATMAALLSRDLVALTDTTSPVLAEEATEHAAGAALEVVDKGGHETARRVHRALGSAQGARVRGESAVHVDAAIACFEKTAAWAWEAGDVAEAAHDSADLALAYAHRQNGLRATNLQTAVAYAQQAVSLYSSLDDHEHDTFSALSTLAVAYQAHGTHDTSADEAARVAYEQILATAPAGADELRAAAHVNVSQIYATRPNGTEQALEHLAEAGGYFTRERDPLRWAQVHHLRGVALMRGRMNDVAAREQARMHYLDALDVLTADGWIAERRRTLNELGAVEFHDRRWAEAYEALAESIAISDYLLPSLQTEAGQHSELTDMRNVYERAAYCLVRQGRADDALPLLDAGKTRLARLVTGDTRPVPQLDLAQIRAATIDDPAVVVPLITSQGSVIFLLTPDPQEPPGGRVVELPSLTDGDLRSVLDGDDHRIGWLFAYRGWLAVQDTATADETRYDAARETWATALTGATATLWHLVMGPIRGALAEAGVPTGATVRILPSKWLSLLPLAAAWRLVDDRPRAFLDDHPSVLSPSVYLLRRARSTSPDVQDRQPVLLAIMDDSGTLSHSANELLAIREVAPFEVREVASSEFSIDGLAAATDVSHLHVACHGYYDWADPSGSGLELDESSLLSARDIGNLRLDSISMVTLSACETGITDADRIQTEFIGLAGSFLSAGAATVLSSLWAVDDESTAVLMASYYRNLFLEKLSPPHALQHAQQSLRDDARYRNPFYWAPFFLAGL